MRVKHCVFKVDRTFHPMRAGLRVFRNKMGTTCEMRVTCHPCRLIILRRSTRAVCGGGCCCVLLVDFRNVHPLIGQLPDPTHICPLTPLPTVLRRRHQETETQKLAWFQITTIRCGTHLISHLGSSYLVFWWQLVVVVFPSSSLKYSNVYSNTSKVNTIHYHDMAPNQNYMAAILVFWW